jgi:hypothetical protein
LIVGRFGEISRDFVKMRDYIVREKAYAYNEHFNSSVNMAMSMFKLSITSRWTLMAARGWARLILDRRRDLINDRPNCATAIEVVGRFGEFSRDFVKMRDYIFRQKAYAYNEHFNSSANMAMSMFKLSITSRWVLMAARGWARPILDHRRDLINDRPNCATAAGAPLDEAQERYHFDNPTAHTSSAYQRSKAE